MSSRLALALGGGAAALALAAGSTVALAAATGGLDATTSPLSSVGPYAARAASCATPSLPGEVVDVRLSDMGAAMSGRGGMGGGMVRGRWAAADAPAGMRGMMWVTLDRSTVPAGTVSLLVANDGSVEHELVVLPLADGARPGQLTISDDGSVAEDDSLGEASATCAGGEGDGIVAGSEGWVTLDLAPGRYELVCNLPGHYAAGMYAELDVTA